MAGPTPVNSMQDSACPQQCGLLLQALECCPVSCQVNMTLRVGKAVEDSGHMPASCQLPLGHSRPC